MKLKNLFGNDRAVSPVIGVILMVAITVILAAVIGSFVLGIGSNVSQNAQAGVTFDEQPDGAVDVTLNSMPNADSVNVDVNDANKSLSSVGDTVTISSGNSTKITVTATLDGETAVIAKYP